MPRTLWLLAICISSIPCLTLSACGSDYIVQPCGEIPQDGCPVGRGGTCDDLACAALYDCTDGAWRLLETCPNGGGGEPDGGNVLDGCVKPIIDHAGETTGCTPDLQNPDCPAVAAEQCVETVCLTDCLDFFLCTQEGWNLVAFCNEEGQIVLTQ